MKEKLLFIDIECANTFNDVCKMCSFGYVITDSEFKVLEKKDIIINPESKYDYYLFKKNSKTKLAHSKEYYNNHKNFVKTYKEIKNILEDDYIAIFGFEVNSDLKFIYDSTKRYKLEEIEVSAYDVRKLYKKFKPEIKGGLISIVNQEFPNNNFDDIHHSSVNDALMTSLLMKKICEDSNINIYDYLSNNDINNEKFDSESYEKKLIEKKDKRKLNEYRGKVNQNPINEDYKNLNYQLSSTLQKDSKLALKYADILFSGGAVMVNKTSEAEYLIAYDQEDVGYLTNILDISNLKIVKINTFFEN